MTQGRASRWTRQPIESQAVLQWLIGIARRDTNVVVAFVILTNLVRAVSSMILTRLLVPEIFGMAGMIGSIGFTVAMMSDLGFQAFVVRHADGDKPRFLNTVWTIALIRSATLTLILVLLAAPIAGLFDKPDLTPMIAFSALGFVVEGMASLTLLTALRKRMVLRLSMLELAVMVAQTMIAAILAYLWRDLWAILVSLLAGSVLKVVLSYTMFPESRRRFAFDTRYARDLWGFARFVTGSSIITLIYLQCDKLVFAKLMSLENFGLYILAGNLASAPLAFASAYASRVLYPSYAQLWRDGCDDLRKHFYAKRRLPSLLYCFAAGGLIGCAPLVIAILYDHRYAGAATYLQVLAIMPLCALASNSANEALVATGRIKVAFEASVTKLLWLAIAAPIGYRLEGEFGLVLCFGLMETPAMLLKWFQMYRVDLLDLRQEMLFFAAGGAGMLLGASGDYLITTLLL